MWEMEQMEMTFSPDNFEYKYAVYIYTHACIE